MYDAFVLDVGCHTSDQGSCLAAQQSGLLTDLANAFVRLLLLCVAYLYDTVISIIANC